MSVDHADSASSTFPPAPRFGLVHSDAASLAVPPIELPAWRPPAEFGALHRPALAASLLQRVLASVREPVQHLLVYGLPAIYVAGISLLIREPDGCMRGWVWLPISDTELFLRPIPADALTVHPCPARTHWLCAIVNAFSCELLEELRTGAGPRVSEAEIAKCLAGYLEALQGWLQRELRRHADLRAMRAKVARALALDPATLALARHVHQETVYNDVEVSARSWNTAVRHLAASI